MKLSVVICSYNPRPDCLLRVLDSLKAQTLPLDQWELLLIDNGSTEPLATSWDLSWHPQARHVEEDCLGLAAARLRAVCEFRAPFLVFVDDDNVLAPDYLATMVMLAARHSHLGVFGAGVIEPEFAHTPPRELTHFLPLLALRKVASACWTNNQRDDVCLPFGAGLGVRRAVAERWRELAEKIDATKLLGPRGPHQYRHDDNLFSWAAVGAGHGLGVFPELRILHLIAAGRLTRGYFLRLLEDATFSHWMLHGLLAGERPEPLGLYRTIRCLLHGMRHGLFSLSCQWACIKGEVAAVNFFSRTKVAPVAATGWKFPGQDIRPAQRHLRPYGIG